MTSLKVCSVTDCDRPAKGRGMCHKHYMRWYSSERAERCTIDGCEKTLYSGGLCGMHYQRRRTTGVIGEAGQKIQRGVPILDRIKANIAEQPNGCWHWTGTIGAQGYGYMKVGLINRLAHRVVYELVVGPITEPSLDHDCHTQDHTCAGGPSCLHRRCVNPEHLKPMTKEQNSSIGVRGRQKVCKRGHDLMDPANLKPTKSGARQCRVCSNLARMDRYRRLGR